MIVLIVIDPVYIYIYIYIHTVEVMVGQGGDCHSCSKRELSMTTQFVGWLVVCKALSVLVLNSWF